MSNIIIEKDKRYILNNGETTEPLVQLSQEHQHSDARFASITSDGMERRWNRYGYSLCPDDKDGSLNIREELVGRGRCKCGGVIISKLCSCGTPHPEYVEPNKMRLIKKRTEHIQLWRGECQQCKSEFELDFNKTTQYIVDRCPRESTCFIHQDCPECGATKGKGVILYPTK